MWGRESEAKHKDAALVVASSAQVIPIADGTPALNAPLTDLPAAPIAPAPAPAAIELPAAPAATAE